MDVVSSPICFIVLFSFRRTRTKFHGILSNPFIFSFFVDFPSLEAPPEFNHKSPRDEILKPEGRERSQVMKHGEQKDSSSILVPEGAPSWVSVSSLMIVLVN